MWRMDWSDRARFPMYLMGALREYYIDPRKIDFWADKKPE